MWAIFLSSPQYQLVNLRSIEFYLSVFLFTFHPFYFFSLLSYRGAVTINTYFRTIAAYPVQYQDRLQLAKATIPFFWLSPLIFVSMIPYHLFF